MRRPFQPISFGLIDGRAVLVDPRTDSYFVLEVGDQDRLLACVGNGWAVNSDDPLNEALGFSDDAVEIVHAQPVFPRKSLIDESASTSARIADVIRIAKLVWNIRLQLRRNPIENVLADSMLWAACTSPKCVQRTDLLAMVRRFISARYLVPAKGNCLVDSLSLLAWLDDARRDVELVFGAKLNPFGAHCWLQLDDLVLNDRLESIAAFTAVRVEKCSDLTL